MPVGERHEPSGALAREYLTALKEIGADFELVVVLDSRHRALRDEIQVLAEAESCVKIVELARSFGESAALTAGFEHTEGEIVLTLPAYYQIQPREIGKLLNELENCDMSIACRWPRASASSFEVFRRNAFHWLVGKMVGNSFSDLGCSARAMKRSVADEIPVYGDQHRFLPLLAIRRGFRVKEKKVAQSELDRYEGKYGVKVYLQRLLDMLTILFLVRFTKKPLRFFGMVGSVTFVVGAVFLFYVVVERLFFDISLADRPALLLSSLLVVLGLQIFGLGLLGELIIFTHAREIKEYTIEEIVN
jgi:glycosyltransferase involved in cell wall biosynthesis